MSAPLPPGLTAAPTGTGPAPAAPGLVPLADVMIRALPDKLAGLDRALVVSGQVVAQEDGKATIRTAAGDVAVETPTPLPTDRPVTLRIPPQVPGTPPRAAAMAPPPAQTPAAPVNSAAVNQANAPQASAPIPQALPQIQPGATIAAIVVAAVQPRPVSPPPPVSTANAAAAAGPTEPPVTGGQKPPLPPAAQPAPPPAPAPAAENAPPPPAAPLPTGSLLASLAGDAPEPTPVAGIQRPPTGGPAPSPPAQTPDGGQEVSTPTPPVRAEQPVDRDAARLARLARYNIPTTPSSGLFTFRDLDGPPADRNGALEARLRGAAPQPPPTAPPTVPTDRPATPALPLRTDAPAPLPPEDAPTPTGTGASTDLARLRGHTAPSAPTAAPTIPTTGGAGPAAPAPAPAPTATPAQDARVREGSPPASGTAPPTIPIPSGPPGPTPSPPPSPQAVPATDGSQLARVRDSQPPSPPTAPPTGPVTAEGSPRPPAPPGDMAEQPVQETRLRAAPPPPPPTAPPTAPAAASPRGDSVPPLPGPRGAMLGEPTQAAQRPDASANPPAAGTGAGSTPAPQTSREPSPGQPAQQEARARDARPPAPPTAPPTTVVTRPDPPSPRALPEPALWQARTRENLPPSPPTAPPTGPIGDPVPVPGRPGQTAPDTGLQTVRARGATPVLPPPPPTAPPTTPAPAKPALTPTSQPESPPEIQLARARGDAPPAPPTAPPTGPAKPAPLPNGQPVQLRVLAVEGNAAPPGTLPAHRDGFPTLPPANSITGTLVGNTAQGQPVVTTSQGTLVLRARTDLPPGTNLTLSLEIPQNRDLAALLPPLDPVQGDDWPAMREVMSTLVAADPAMARAIAATILPQPTKRLTTNLTFFLAALRGGDAAGWLGADATELLTARGGGRLLAQLREDFQAAARQAAEPTPDGWRAMPIPFGTPDQVMRAQLHVRSATEQEGEEQRGEGRGPPKRFLLDLSFSNIGPMQLDGMVWTGRFDLMIRTQRLLPADLRQSIGSLFRDSLETVGYAGNIGFQTGAHAWARVQSAQRGPGVRA